MSVQLSSSARLGRIGLAIAAVHGLVACATGDAPSESQRSSAATVAAQSFVARPVQHLLFTAKSNAAASAEAYFKSSILPELARDPRIGDVAIFGDPRSGGYIIEIDVHTVSPVNLSLALEILGAGRTEDQTRKLIAGLAKYFDLANVQQLTPRADLSVS